MNVFSRIVIAVRRILSAMFVIPFVLVKLASAAEIEVNHIENTTVISIKGIIKAEDEGTFEKLVGRHHPDLAIVGGDGGAALPAMGIGQIIRGRDMDTLVLGHVTCASSCALIWLGGVKRYYGPGAKIGFHGVFNGMTRDVSGPGNAVIGAYLSKLGLPYRAIAFITEALPDEIQWLTYEKARMLGINVEPIKASSRRG
jgi:hypothetical protein